MLMGDIYFGLTLPLHTESHVLRVSRQVGNDVTAELGESAVIVSHRGFVHAQSTVAPRALELTSLKSTLPN